MRASLVDDIFISIRDKKWICQTWLTDISEQNRITIILVMQKLRDLMRIN